MQTLSAWRREDSLLGSMMILDSGTEPYSPQCRWRGKSQVLNPLNLAQKKSPNPAQAITLQARTRKWQLWHAATCCDMLRHAATCCDSAAAFFCSEANRRFFWFMQWCPDALWATEKHPMHTEAYGQLLVPSLLRQNRCHLQTPRIRVVHAVSQKGCLIYAYTSIFFKTWTQITI